MSAAREPNGVPEIIGKYEVFSPFAHGGMASVHIGRVRGPSGFSRLFAIKRLNPVFASSDRHVRMLLEEARVAARLRSPFAVPVLEVVHEASDVCIVMDLVLGVSLAALLAAAIERGIRPSPGVVVAIVADALRGLHDAHQAVDTEGRPLEIVHRDVSPQNVLVGADGMSRVLDFGIARALGRVPLTASGEVHGKLAYMAPEQLRGEVLTRQADIYAAGVVLWEGLTLERLRPDPAAVVSSLELEPPAPSAKVEGLPRALDFVVETALSREPGSRFPSAEAMVAALEEACAPAPREEVAAFVERVADEELERLREAVKRAERHVAVPASAPTQRRGPWPLIALGAGVIALGVSAALVQQRLAARPAAPPETPTPVTVQSSAPSPPEPAAAPPSVDVPSALPVPAAPARAPALSRRARACTPPFDIDKNGIKHYKPACIP
jgi:serine/threonine protein kinase